MLFTPYSCASRCSPVRGFGDTIQDLFEDLPHPLTYEWQGLALLPKSDKVSSFFRLGSTATCNKTVTGTQASYWMEISSRDIAYVRVQCCRLRALRSNANVV